MARKSIWVATGLVTLIVLGNGIAFPSPAAAQELLCPETGLPWSQPGCRSHRADSNDPVPLPPRRIPPGMDPANLPPSDIPPGHWWGSVVVASDRQLYTSYVRPDREAAEREALGKCEGNAATGCTVLDTVRAQDLALATDGTHTVSASAVGQKKAIDKALAQCRKQGGTVTGQCRVSLLFSPITGPVPENVVQVIFGR